VPKSRSRVKKNKSSKSAAHKTRQQRLSADPWSGGLFETDPRIRARRDRAAHQMAREELPALLEIAGRPHLDAAEVEDAICTHLGDLMHRYDVNDVDDEANPHGAVYIEPDRVLGALTRAVTEALGAPAEVPQAPDFGPGGSLFAPWRLWEVLRETAPEGEAGALYGFEHTLRSRLAAPLPASTVRNVVADSLRWARDAYGSRFLITVEFERAGRTRWYAWDIDACGFEAVTVDAGFHESSASALASWRAAVGETAAASAALEQVNDAAQERVLAALLPEIEDLGRIGGESAGQLGEYHRARRLAQALRKAGRFAGTAPGADSGPEKHFEHRAEQFASWLAEREPGRAFAFDVKELAWELAETWAGAVPQELFLTCSPHRVAAKVRALHGYYRQDFAAALQEALPSWVRWIAQQTGLAEHLLERSLEYCDGRTHPAQAGDERELNWYARCAE
jgi:hypothetical protein